MSPRLCHESYSIDWILSTERIRTRVFGGYAGFTGKVGSSTFCVVSLEKFFIAIIIPNFSG